jgi:hypothetical protein
MLEDFKDELVVEYKNDFVCNIGLVTVELVLAFSEELFEQSSHTF